MAIQYFVMLDSQNTKSSELIQKKWKNNHIVQFQ